MEWETHARRLADEVVRPDSRWYGPIAGTPRHVFVPNWWERGEEAWEHRSGVADAARWMAAAYADRTLVTRVRALHADEAAPGTVVAGGGLPTSSSTLPGLVVAMYRHAMLTDDVRVLVTTGTGYGTALVSRRVGADRVTSVDVDPYVVAAAGERLEAIGLRPDLGVVDLTGPLPGTYDRIVSTVSVRPVPASWLAALRPGGRLVTTVAGTGLVLTADRTPDGGAVGRIEPDPAGFMRTRHGSDYPPLAPEVWAAAEKGEGEEVTTCRYPLLYPPDAWDVMSMLALAVPGIEYRSSVDGESRTVWLLHADGSWARATASSFLASPTVHQGGPQRLWRELERVRNRLNRTGTLPVYGARAVIGPDGTTTLSRGGWTATL